jgi:4-hydroxy-3-methylbut-2-enyl diphosphate reductase
LAVLKKRFPQIRECSGVCDASKKRQDAVIKLASQCDVVLVIGSPHSSNAKRLREIAFQHGAESFLIDNAGEMPEAAVTAAEIVGITSGASTPEYLFDEVIAKLESLGFTCGNDAVPGTQDT